MWPNPLETADLVTFTGETLMENFCAVIIVISIIIIISSIINMIIITDLQLLTGS